MFRWVRFRDFDVLCDRSRQIATDRDALGTLWDARRRTHGTAVGFGRGAEQFVRSGMFHWVRFHESVIAVARVALRALPNRNVSDLSKSELHPNGGRS